MKESYYNYYLPHNKVVLFYNSFRDAYLALNKTLFEDVTFDNRINLEILKEKYPKVLDSLCQNGFIVDDNLEEQILYENLYYRRRFDKKCYDITINPTLDCNLKCWYCYESHKKTSILSDELSNNIITHIKNKCETEPFEFLKLNFFGGEPILKPQVVKDLILRIKNLSVEYEFEVHIHFTTNGTIIPKSLLDVLKDCRVSFQITIDGNKSSHNSVRVRKMSGNEKGTYNIILNNIRRICDGLENSMVNVRINFSNETLKNIESLIDDLDFCDRKKVSISLHKVWQVDNESINKARLFEFIRYANSKQFIVHYMMLNNYGGSACYADNYNQVVINYDGKIFKCTARDFNDENCEGVLTKEGLINWNTDRLLYRMNIRIAENCKKCKLLPSCPGICSQKKMENQDEVLCALDNDFTIQDYIIHNFNNKVLEAKIKTL